LASDIRRCTASSRDDGAHTEAVWRGHDADNDRVPIARQVQPLPVPGGKAALDIRPALERALDGVGPALLPVPGDDDQTARATRVAIGAGQPLEPHEDDPDDPTALIITTSGSTGAPKGVLLSASALRASANATHERLGGCGHWLLAMPAHHIAGIQVLIRTLLAGTTPHAVDTSSGFRTERFVAAANDTLAAAGRRYTALVPTQLGRLLNDAGEGLTALREFDAVLLGGAATPPSLLRQAREAGVNVVTTYGMSETSGGCVYDGSPLNGVEVRVVPQTRDPSTGEVQLSGPVLARGYRPGRDTAVGFADGWFRTGDLGQWHEGTLRIIGRADDIIVTGGVKVAPAVVERILTDLVDVREACVLGVEDREWGQAVVAAVVPADPASPPSADALRGAVRERGSAAQVPKRIVVLPELPLRGPGKPDREALRIRLAAEAGVSR
jgi:O-succinylbenzoic acid--CoA ligase